MTVIAGSSGRLKGNLPKLQEVIPIKNNSGQKYVKRLYNFQIGVDSIMTQS